MRPVDLSHLTVTVKLPCVESIQMGVPLRVCELALHIRRTVTTTSELQLLMPTSLSDSLCTYVFKSHCFNVNFCCTLFLFDLSTYFVDFCIVQLAQMNMGVVLISF